MTNDHAELRIERATESDVADLLMLIKALADYEHLAVAADEARVRDSLFGPRPAAGALMARLGGGAVGFAVWFHNFSTFLGRRGLYLEDVFVRPEWRGRGVGRALLSRLAAMAIERDCGRMEWTVLDWNANAIAFYKRLGAEVLDDWRVCRLSGDALRKLASGSGL